MSRPRPTAPRLNKLNRPTVTIERIVGGGLGIGHADGKTIFASGAAAGDKAVVQLDKIKGNVAFGSVLELLTPSPDRAEPICPYYGVCGGCDFQHISYEAQLSAKTGIVLDALRRIGGIDWQQEIPITPSPEVGNYRTRVTWQATTSTGAFGYFAAKSHDVVDVEFCPVSPEPLNETLGQLRQLIGSDITIHAATDGENVSLDPAIGSQSVQPLQLIVDGERIGFDASVFFQANIFLVEALVQEALRYAAPRAQSVPAHGFAMDLYSGVGLFTIPLARRYRRIVAVESDPGAVLWAHRNLENAKLPSVDVVESTVEAWIPTARRAFGRPTLVVVDPPRAGLDRKVAEELVRMRPRHLAYVSCDPASLARDLKMFVAGGFTLDRVAALDMFPQTHHVETVAHLSYNPEPKSPPVE